MEPAPGSRVLVCAHDAATDDVCRRLAEAGHSVRGHDSGLLDPDDLADYQAVVVEAGQPPEAALQFCRRVRTALGDGYVPVLFVSGADSPADRLAAFEAGADAWLARPFEGDVFLAQVRALLRNKDRHDRLRARTVELQHTTRRLQQAHQRVNHELELARRIQQSFLPQTLPEVPRARFAVHYQPCGRVGGDFYDVFRLDEHHVGFYVADAMGHGVPAGLLTMFLKKGVRAKEIYQTQYRLVPPEEVLQRLNRDLIEQGLSDNSFITMVYALYNAQQGTLHFSRAGHPHPVYVPGDGEPELWKVPGSLLGVFETRFGDQVYHLRPGDKVLFYTDGTEEMSFDGHPAGTESFLACVRQHRAKPVGELVQALARDLLRRESQPDDFTLLGLEVGE